MARRIAQREATIERMKMEYYLKSKHYEEIGLVEISQSMWEALVHKGFKAKGPYESEEPHFMVVEDGGNEK